MLPFAELILTGRELRVLYRVRPNSHAPSRLPKDLSFPRERIAEFRVNCFDGGVYVRVVGEHVGNIELPGGRRAADSSWRSWNLCWRRLLIALRRRKRKLPS
jgi:hypothetical protein